MDKIVPCLDNHIKSFINSIKSISKYSTNEALMAGFIGQDKFGDLDEIIR